MAVNTYQGQARLRGLIYMQVRARSCVPLPLVAPPRAQRGRRVCGDD